MMDELDSGALDTVLTLPACTSAADIALACRDAAMEFSNDSKSWSKVQLGMWLSASYGPLTKFASKETGEVVETLPLLPDIDGRLIDRMIESARAEIFEELARITKDGSATFVLRALITGAVTRCEDSTGQPTWAPTGAAVRLAERVLALFAVDYLASSVGYETDLLVCSQCGTISFDAITKKDGCACHHTVSVVAPRRCTIPYPSLSA